MPESSRSAELAGINMSYVSRLENGHHEPSIEVLKNLIRIFEVSADYLLSEEEEEYEVNLKDRALAEKIRLIETLPERKKEALMEIIDDMLTNEKLRSMLQNDKEALVG
jgi:transcriptional regulator with XRE-family HTH domain